MKNFKSFPGEINAAGYHEFPKLWLVDDKKRLREWQIFTRLIKPTRKPITSIDWDELAEILIPIRSDLYSDDPKVSAISDVYAEAWTQTGISGRKITKSAPTYFTKPLNVGRSNERNVFQTALIYARDQWEKRKRKGSTEEKPNIDVDHDDNTDETDSKQEKVKSDAKQTGKTTGNLNTMYFPMLAKTYEDGSRYLHYPLYIQPKLDGIRCLVYLQKFSNDYRDVITYTRAKRPFGMTDYIKKALLPLLRQLYDKKKKQSIYLDGELYRHGKKLQDISGDSRNDKADTTSANRNEYHIYDCFYPLELDTKFSERYEQLQEVYKAIDILQKSDQSTGNNEDDGNKSDESKSDDKVEGKIDDIDREQSDKSDEKSDNESDKDESDKDKSDKDESDKDDDSVESKKENKEKTQTTKQKKSNNNSGVIKAVPCYLVKDQKAANEYYKKFVSMGYEGAMLRNADGPYLANAEKTGAFMRSKDLVKMKPSFTEEYQVVNFTEGSRGKDKGAIIWQCTVKPGDKSPQYVFNVVPKNIDYEERRRLYQDAKKNFAAKYKDRMLTVEFQDKSKDQIPQRAKSIALHLLSLHQKEVDIVLSKTFPYQKQVGLPDFLCLSQ